jgi:mRNA deadenylase 3'-5' endonuclease subunit Ccr4
LGGAGRSRDIVCLQEVEAGEMPYYEQALGGGFAGAFASRDPAYWSNWLVPELPWVPNAMPCSCAVRRWPSSASVTCRSASPATTP